MAKTKTSRGKKDDEKKLGTCRECALSYDYHELTNTKPRLPFLCKCPHETWSQFLDKKCINGKFEKK